ASYTVTVHLGDYSASHGTNGKPINIYVNNVLVDSITTKAGVFFQKSYTVAKAKFPANGILNTRFQTTSSDGFDVNGIDVATPVQAEGGLVVHHGVVTPLTEAELAPVVDEAVNRWIATGLTPNLVQRLEASPVSLAHLGGPGYLGVTTGQGI